MAQFTVNAERYDPYRNFKFRVKFDGRVVAGVSKVSALKRTTKVVEHREGGDPSTSRKSPGRTEYEAITLERGLTHDKVFVNWANTVWNLGARAGSETGLKNFRRTVTLELLNEAGQPALVYHIKRCWVSEITVMPDLDANGEAVAIESIQLQNEGFEEDTNEREPAEPTLAFPG